MSHANMQTERSFKIILNGDVDKCLRIEIFVVDIVIFDIQDDFVFEYLIIGTNIVKFQQNDYDSTDPA